MEPELARLAAVALNDEGRRIAEQACADLESLGYDAWIERYDQLAEDASDEPSEAEILVVVGQQHDSIGRVDWSGEDDDHQVQDMVTQACAGLGLATPAIPDDISDQVVSGLDSPQRGDYIPALLRAIDDHLAAAGMRLLIIDLDSDMYNFVPVTADTFAAFVGHTGEGFSLRAVDPKPR